MKMAFRVLLGRAFLGLRAVDFVLGVNLRMVRMVAEKGSGHVRGDQGWAGRRVVVCGGESIDGRVAGVLVSSEQSVTEFFDSRRCCLDTIVYR